METSHLERNQGNDEAAMSHIADTQRPLPIPCQSGLPKQRSGDATVLLFAVAKGQGRRRIAARSKR